VAAALCAAALAGCAPAYSDYADAVTDKSVARSKRQARHKPVPLPSQALLEPQSKPDCGEAAAAALADKPKGAPTRLAERAGAEPSPGSDAAPQAASAAAPPQPDPNADLALRIKLEYERECYRMAEMRVRERLRKLQASTSETVKAVKQLQDGEH
jgi:hypothetical protein